MPHILHLLVYKNVSQMYRLHSTSGTSGESQNLCLRAQSRQGRDAQTVPSAFSYAKGTVMDGLLFADMGYQTGLLPKEVAASERIC